MAVVATDDTIFFHREEDQAQRRLELFDAAFDKFGLVRAVEKDVNLASEIIALGCHITSDPPLVSPEVNKLWRLLLAIVDLDSGHRASPKGLHGPLGGRPMVQRLVTTSFLILQRSVSFCQTGA